MHWPVYPDGNLAGVAGVLLAFFSLWGARVGRQSGPEPQRLRDSTSIFGIAVQGLGIGAVWFGPMRLAMPDTATLWIEGALEAALALSGTALFYWARATMGRNWSLVARTRSDGELVQSGPFALVRHPIYVAIFFMMVATALATGHTFNLVVGIPVYIIGTLMRTQIEERLLRETFANYSDYAKRVKRFIPGVW
jgi:protein-S-isoprenylcysteine O-methyltransferase Ste14